MDLLELPGDIIGLPTPMWRNEFVPAGKIPIEWNVYEWLPELDSWKGKPPGRGLQEVDAVGSGSVIIHRRVLECVKPLFERTYDEWGVAQQGSDLRLCLRAREAGFKVFCHWDYPCHHIKTVDLLDVDRAMRYRDISGANLPQINTEEEWDARWAEREDREYPFHEYIANQVAGERVLDFGCGIGTLLAKLGPLAEGMDISPKAVERCKARGLKASVGTEPKGYWDAIVCTEVLEHLDDDVGMLEKFFDCTKRVIYSVPNDCLPPGLEPEHRRVYTAEYVERITPHIKGIRDYGEFMVVEASRL